jgi:hypothetical protein
MGTISSKALATLIRFMVVVLVCGMACSRESLRVEAQSLPPLGELARSIPTDAVSADIRVFILERQPHAVVQYTRAEDARVLAANRTVPFSREYTNIYRWSGTSWHKIFDGYQFAQAFYIASPSATTAALGTTDPIGLTGDSPTPTTAFVSIAVRPLIRRPRDDSMMPDLLVLTVEYLLGPNSVQHPSPSLAVLRPTADGVAMVYATDFHVRGNIRDVYRVGDEVYVRADANLPWDGACCPSGTEFVRLVWRAGILVETERCIRQSLRVRSCTDRSWSAVLPLPVRWPQSHPEDRQNRSHWPDGKREAQHPSRSADPAADALEPP